MTVLKSWKIWRKREEYSVTTAECIKRLEYMIRILQSGCNGAFVRLRNVPENMQALIYARNKMRNDNDKSDSR